MKHRNLRRGCQPATIAKICSAATRPSSGNSATAPAWRLRWTASLTLWTALVLAGCSPGNDPAGALANYNARLAQLLDGELPVVAATRVPIWPQPRALPAPPSEVRFDLFGFPDAGRCSLLQEVSRRGSSMNPATPPRELLQQMRLLRALDQCAQITAGDLQSGDVTRRAFAVAVRDALQQKQQELPRTYWYSTLGSAEIRDFFSVAVLPLRLDDGSAPTTGVATSIGWLAALGRLPADAPLPAQEAVSEHFYRLLGNKLGGRTWLSLDLGMRELDRSSRLLEAAPRARLCPGGQHSADAEGLRALYETKFRQRLQPWLHDTRAAGEVLAAALEQLWLAQKITPPAEVGQYRRSVWLATPGSLVHDYGFAVRRHDAAWRALLGACGYREAVATAP